MSQNETSSSSATRRNTTVEEAVLAVIRRVDDFIAGEKVDLPSPTHRKACEDLLTRRASVRLATLFLMFYWLQDAAWDLKSVPIGIRGKFGDKRLSEALTQRHITLHDAITAFGENLGWKGNVRAFDLSTDVRFNSFLAGVADAEPAERQKIADYLASRFAESRREPAPLPPVGSDVLTFIRARVLFYRLLGTATGGHIQQFLMAALLQQFRQRYGLVVRTHHPDASDRFDGTAGDIEELRDDQLIRAYEVTVRPDWKSRISNFKNKMDLFHLNKYVIFAADVNKDPELAEPAQMAFRLETYERDIAVVDIRDAVNYLAAELSAEELRAVVNRTYELLSNPKLSGREDYKEMYRNVVSEWLDTA